MSRHDCPGKTAPVVLKLTTPTGVTLSYEVEGDGPPLVLVHGSFSDHCSNWAPVRPNLVERFTLYALARRGRGETDATTRHSVEDEAHDVEALIRAIGDEVYLVGHSYGAQVALAAAARCEGLVRKLVLYEPPKPESADPEAVRELESIARREDWDALAETFFREFLEVRPDELEGLRASAFWPPIIKDARASLGDLRALVGYSFSAERFRSLRIPVFLQFGSESPGHMFATDELARVLPDARTDELAGQGHDAMITAPDDYSRSLVAFLTA